MKKETFIYETELISKRRAIYWSIEYFRKNKYENEILISVFWKTTFGKSKNDKCRIRREGLSTIFMMDIVDAKNFLDNSNLKTLNKNQILTGWEYLKNVQIKKSFLKRILAKK